MRKQRRQMAGAAAALLAAGLLTGCGGSQNGLRRGSSGSGCGGLGRFGLLILRDGDFAFDQNDDHQRDEADENDCVAEQRDQSGRADLEVNHSGIYQKHS